MQRRRLDDDLHVLVSEVLEERGFSATFTERRGGTSSPPYDTLNLDPRRGRVADVRRNRERIAHALGMRAFAVGEQAHGAGIARVGEKRAAAGWDGAPPLPGVDALEATRPGLALGILTADCLPIALGSARQGLLSVVHAGWRGLAAGILGAAVASFDAPGGVVAAIGPAIGPCHYEVGQDVALAVAAGSDAGAVTDRRGGRLFLDLPGTAARILRAAGVRTIDRAGECTACEPDRFFSHRRDGETGRQALIAMRVPR